jgi:poly(3-hydroxyalkanoate) depolymerase
MGYRRADIAGVSWGGGIAQQFAHQHYDMCRRIVLAATSPGAFMIPGDPRVLWKLATPRRYVDKDFMRRVAPEIYGGAFRNNPDILAAHTKAMTGTTDKGYLYQLIAMAGWTSLPWLWTLKQPALILAGRDDPIVPLANARLMARLMPNAKLKILDDGHLFLVTRPIESAAIIEGFLAE